MRGLYKRYSRYWHCVGGRPAMISRNNIVSMRFYVYSVHFIFEISRRSFCATTSISNRTDLILTREPHWTSSQFLCTYFSNTAVSLSHTHTHSYSIVTNEIKCSFRKETTGVFDFGWRSKWNKRILNASSVAELQLIISTNDFSLFSKKKIIIIITNIRWEKKEKKTIRIDTIPRRNINIIYTNSICGDNILLHSYRYNHRVTHNITFVGTNKCRRNVNEIYAISDREFFCSVIICSIFTLNSHWSRKETRILHRLVFVSQLKSRIRIINSYI